MRLTRFWAGLAIIYGFFVVYATLFPFAFAIHSIEEINLNLPSLWGVLRQGRFAGYGDIVANLFFFFPLGLFLGKSYGDSRIRWILGSLIFGLCFMLSTMVEYLQTFTVNRHPSVYDVVCNGVGGLAGYAFSFSPIFRFKNAPPRLRILMASRWFLPSVGSLLLVMIELLQPFNFSLAKAPLWWKINNAFFDLGPWELPNLLGQFRLVLILSLASALLAAWLFELGVQNFLRKAFLSCWVVGSLLELLQLIILSRAPGFVEFFGVFSGSLAGVLIFLTLPQKGVVRPVLFWAAAALAFAVLFSSSLPPNMDLNRIHSLRYFQIRSEESRWVSVLLNHLGLFFFFGLLIPYWVFRYRQTPKATLRNAFVFFITFFLVVKFGIRFSPLQNVYRYALPLLGLFLGYVVFIWIGGIMRMNEISKT